jgi:hypothetical protein
LKIILRAVFENPAQGCFLKPRSGLLLKIMLRAVFQDLAQGCFPEAPSDWP